MLAAVSLPLLCSSSFCSCSFLCFHLLSVISTFPPSFFAFTSTSPPASSMWTLPPCWSSTTRAWTPPISGPLRRSTRRPRRGGLSSVLCYWPTELIQQWRTRRDRHRWTWQRYEKLSKKWFTVFILNMCNDAAQSSIISSNWSWLVMVTHADCGAPWRKFAQIEMVEQVVFKLGAR